MAAAVHRVDTPAAYQHQRLIPATLTPKEVALLMVDASVAKHAQPLSSLFLKSVIAGAFLSFGGFLDLILVAGATGLTASNPGIVKVLGGFVFPIGLTMIVITGAELLTSNMMTFPMALLKRRIPMWSLPWNWFVVFWGNLVGSLFFAAILVKYAGLMDADPYHAYIVKFVVAKVNTPTWHMIFLRGIGCNWLVNIAVWMAAGANETVSKVFAIWLPIWCFVAVGYDHVVANMFSIPLSIMMGGPLTSGKYIWKSLIPSFIGNVIGALFVSFPAWWFYLRDVPNGPAGTLRADLEAGNANGIGPIRDSEVTDKATHVS